jgi:CheY-like chemotaxis protein
MEKLDLRNQPRHILYIDDDPVVCTIVQCCLERFNHWQVTTTPGRKILEQAGAYPWDAILLEIALFDSDGWAVHDQLVTNLKTQSIPLLLLTSKVMRSDYRKYAQMAIAGVIAKPFDPLTLGLKIATLKGWKAASGSYPVENSEPQYHRENVRSILATITMSMG